MSTEYPLSVHCRIPPRLCSRESFPIVWLRLTIARSTLQRSKCTRQTLLFSATLPKDVLHVAKFATNQSARVVDTVGDSEEQTNAQVTQQARTYVGVPPARLWDATDAG